MTDVSCSHQCTWPDCTQSEELREGIKRHEEMAGMATAEIAVLTDALAEQRLQYVALFGQFESATAELARLRAQEPDAWTDGNALFNLAGGAIGYIWPVKQSDAAIPLYRAAPPAQPAEPQAQTVCKRTLIELDARLRECSIVGASAADAYDTFYQHMVETALAAQPAEPVQRLSDAGIEALAGKHGTTYRNRHFPTQPAFSFSNGSLHRFVRDIESAIQPQPGWRDVESAPKDGTDVWLHADGKVLRAFWLVKPYRETRDLDGNYLDHQDYDEFWMSCADGDEVEDPTEWQPLVTPLPPKATK